MKQFVFFVLTIVALTMACTDQDDDVEGVNIRIKNNSSLVFDTVIVGEAAEPHENVASGDYSAYFLYEEAYRYAYIEITSGEDTFVLQPIDFVGETPLPIGFYTYELDVSESGDVLLEFVVD